MSRYNTALRFFNNKSQSTQIREKSGIELYRKGDAEITITSSDGKPVEDATVVFTQKNHEFRFGANIFMLDEFENDEKNAIYREKFPELFNLATVPFYWSDLEPEEGHPRFAADSKKIYRRPATDLCVNYCLENGIEPKCHCLNYDNFTPEWAKHLTVQESKVKMEKRFREIAERYANVINSFEVTNETLQDNLKRTKFYFEDDFVEWSFRMADRYFPLNHLIINDYNYWTPTVWSGRNLYYQQIEKLLRDGITHLDSVGLQFHSFFSREREEEMASERYDPENLYRMMDLFARLGKPLQITEMTIPAYSSLPEDEDIQAELLRGVYTTFFSHPAMEAIIYWNLVDGYAAFAPLGDMTHGENYFHGGLMRFDMSEKPSFRVLKDLIHKEWHTDGSVKTSDGKAKFRGFYGDYDIVIHADGKSIPARISLSRYGDNKFSFSC